MTLAEFLRYDAVPMLIGLLAGAACALPGTFLLLRRQALIGDAISHVVLPGIVVAFVVTGSRATWPMLLGAGAAALVAAGLIEAIRRLGRMEPGAAMGVVFTAMFAGGVLLLEVTDTSGVHLDVEHALYGSLESLIWFDAEGLGSLADPAALAGLPPELARMAGVTAVAALFVAILWRPLALSTFDEGYARAVGVPVSALGAGLVAVAAAAAVAAFDAVGSILVVAMFVCPPATARLLTDRLDATLLWAVAAAAVSAVLGVWLAGRAPLWLGAEQSVSAAGMIAVVSGLLLALAAVFGPRRARSTESPL